MKTAVVLTVFNSIVLRTDHTNFDSLDFFPIWRSATNQHNKSIYGLNLKGGNHFGVENYKTFYL